MGIEKRMIVQFIDIEDVLQFIRYHSEDSKFIKAEVYRTGDQRYRVGIYFAEGSEQLELPLDEDFRIERY